MSFVILFFFSCVLSLICGEHHNHKIETNQGHHVYRRHRAAFGNFTDWLRPYIWLPLVASSIASLLPHSIDIVFIVTAYVLVTQHPLLKKYPVLRSLINTIEEVGEDRPWNLWPATIYRH